MVHFLHSSSTLTIIYCFCFALFAPFFFTGYASFNPRLSFFQEHRLNLMSFWKACLNSSLKTV